jgi:valyl-tRNA synthetase
MVNGGKNAMEKSDSQSVQVLNPVKEVCQLYQELAKQKNPSNEDVDRLRRLLVSIPAVWPLAIHMMPLIQQTLIEKMSNCVSRACMLAEMDILEKQLDYDAAPPLERLLIEHILTVRLRLIHAETCYNNAVVNQSITFKTGEYWDSLLSSTQARFLRAIETLARVRRLARNTPALQINIAREGGQQVNVQGDVNGQKATTPAETKPELPA